MEHIKDIEIFSNSNKPDPAQVDAAHAPPRALLPERYKEASIENIDPSIKKWLVEKKVGKRGIFIYGGVGVGKTYTAYAMYRWIVEETDFRSRIENISTILDDIKQDFKASTDPYMYRQPRAEYWFDYHGVLFIDDLGVERLTDWVLETFYKLLNSRYEKNLPTIFTSNYTIEEIAERLGDRIASRIVEMCEIKKISGEDRRV